MRIANLILGGTAFLMLSCGQGPAESEGNVPATLEGQIARERAAVLFSEDRIPEAAEALKPLVDCPQPLAEDFLRMGIVELSLGDTDAAREHLQKALKRIPDSPSLHFNLGRLAIRDSAYETASREFARAWKLAPEDIPSLFQLAASKATLGEDEAEDLFENLLGIGIETTASWHLAALYRLGRFQLESGNSTDSRATLGEFSRLQATGMGTLSATQMDHGNFGKLLLPAPLRFPAKNLLPLEFSEETFLATFQSIKGFSVVDLVDDWVLPDGDETTITSLGSTNLLAWGEDGIFVAAMEGPSKWTIHNVWPESADLVRGLDYDQDGDLDFWVFSAGQVQLLEQEQGIFTRADLILPTFPGPVADAVVVDEDHEGDLDLLLVGKFGVRLWRDDGAAQGGQFTDVTEDSGIAISEDLSWCTTEDFDTDEDVDFIVAGAHSSYILSNQRGGKYLKQSFAFSTQGIGAQNPVVKDWNGDGIPDIRFSKESAWMGVPGGTFIPSEQELPLPAQLVDINRDHIRDHISLSEGKMEVAYGLPGKSGSMILALRGTTDNRRGIGSIVEYRAGDFYQRIYWRGEPMVLDLMGHSQADWLKITWPNGVTQFGVDIPDQELMILSQKEGLAGSCPFLYTWNGTTYEFISDVIGATPLGLPIAEGQFVPPDHDEYVLVRGDQLVAKDGLLDIQLTEELREVTFFDRVRLDVLDHPSESEVYPNERFTFPPFPVAHNHTVVNPLTPVHARGSDGKDWTQALQKIDFHFAVPFEPYQSTVPSAQPWGGQFLGLAPKHSLELEFQGASIRKAKKLRLLITGWFYWSVASVNMASSRTPGIDFVPPMLEVPDGHGGWRVANPEIGFPSGKLKTMVIDVSKILLREDPRIRISSTLRLYWDSIRLATDADDAPLHVTSLEPLSGNLWQRGFSKPVELEESAELLLEWFQWDELESYPRWNQHPGLYTKLGDVLPLLTKAEDMFVVMGSGDALHVQFDAKALPELPSGWKRDYLVYLDGWAKDRDYNCANVEFTEPFPFHAMSGFPYRSDESFPDDEAHRQWRLDWLTRFPRLWISEITSR